MSIRTIESDSQWKITSGSFIYGPSGAVKELIDNSIDGGAKNIFIDIDSKSGGCEYISVRDDGHGIDEADRPLLCRNHTTSKITSLEDISESHALGFRGEALFMLATLSAERGSMQIITKIAEDQIGTKWFVDKQGEMKQPSVSKVTCPQGTTVIIRKILGGLRSRDIEMRSNSRRTLDELKKMVDHYSLDHRHLRFNLSFVSLKKNGAVAIKTLQEPCSTNISKTRVLSAILHLKKPISTNFITFDAMEVNGDLTMEVVLPRMTPESDVINAKKTLKFLSVNSRAMSLQLPFGKDVNKLVNSIHREMKLLEPVVWYINLGINRRLIDVNIEPEKNDVLIGNHDTLLEEIKTTLSRALVHEYGLDLPKNDDEQVKDKHNSNVHSDTIDLSGELDIAFVDDVASSLDQVPAKHQSLFVNDDDLADGDMSKQILEPPVSSHSGSMPMVSDEGEWTHTLLEKSPSIDLSGNGEDPRDMSVPVHTDDRDDEDSTRHNEDLDLSKDLSLSNPFTIAKLNKKRAVTALPTETDDASIETVVSKKPRISRETEAVLRELQRSPQADKPIVQSATLKIKKNERHLTMFSEYTNSLVLPVLYPGRGATPVGEVLPNITLGDKVSNGIRDVLQEKFPAMSSAPIANCLTTTPGGWYLFRPQSPPQ
ncbi:mismatch repair protein [Maudiozyma humilis]|uniref:Mismatch repair protein n=1 Tax=Maudiozyma humilis TaxID=51915 RepID=A0AAV5RR98_MAUHU|nr:mismatch repair protein [Kazachstania humilis]